MKKITTALLCCFLAATSIFAQKYVPTPENLKARQAFDEARFGMFIHWGSSSVLGDGEWVMNNKNIKIKDYQRLQRAFNPVDFDAKTWVGIAKNAGMKYITLITRHHDGFSNFHTQYSDWGIANTPFKRDIVKEIADECHKQGIKICFYYSLLDWYRTDYPYETGKTGKGTGRTEKSNYVSYLQFMKNQLTELLTKYGEVSTIWFDGHWDQLDNDHDKTLQSKIDWKYDEIYSLIHKLQPQCLIGNNHHLLPIDGEDFQMFERDLPGENKSGLSGQEIGKLPLETCETLNGSWGYNIKDNSYKTPKELVDYLVRAAGYGANFLLNVGPMPNGEIQPEFVERLSKVGDFMKVYGSTIYGTQGGFIRPQDWGAVTEKGNKIYLHLLKQKEDKWMIKIPVSFKTAKYFKSGAPVKFQKLDNNFVVFDINPAQRDELDTVIELEK
ncbi:alpha-L-fucosidase [Flectobacillus roseus]|uniref:alpha-L-fucosidase n=1 Tax=Flectobacillus roseus TaxID=502259 RepID=UPI0024B7E35B|nr:alpha-L-fucosidase [Flectobacillus roseus]MDI9868150.1 alpha-L-fucosidase [Flectobacillus roseus]